MTDDGGEMDLDLVRTSHCIVSERRATYKSKGNYERYLLTALTRDHNITTGKIYQSVIERERRGDFLGKTVQV